MTLTFTLCMIISGAYANCITQTIMMQDHVTTQQCVIAAPPVIADWVTKHYDKAGYVVTHWGCSGI